MHTQMFIDEYVLYICVWIYIHGDSSDKRHTKSNSHYWIYYIVIEFEKTKHYNEVPGVCYIQ